MFPNGWDLELGPTVRAFREQFQVVNRALPHRLVLPFNPVAGALPIAGPT